MGNTLTLPPLRKTVEIEFWSLRNGIGQSGGVILDIDTIVYRDAYRKRIENGTWKWQIKGQKKLATRDYYVDTDQESLDELEATALPFKYI